MLSPNTSSFSKPSGSSIYLNSGDPRTSSSQSIPPPEYSEREGRRKLLLVYIHGFMGDETSFRSFPAHIHNVLSITLSESHVIHSKIYPKYRSRRAIEEATNAFSEWLTPHEGDDVDVILISHSMGGLLAADAVLLPPRPPYRHGAPPLRHKILGTLNFDVPFLGMHPGVVGAGLASIFKPGGGAVNKDQLAQEQGSDTLETSQTGSSANSSLASLAPNTPRTPPRTDTLFDKPKDGNFNPSFANDVHLAVRKGWEGPKHFLKKHSDNLFKASKQYVSSTLEFGGAMADYHGLKRRYARIRALEEETQVVRDRAALGSSHPPRVRFLNYYTACSGFPKKQKPTEENKEATSSGMYSQSLTSATGSLTLAPSTAATGSPSTSPRISVEEHRRDGVLQKDPDMPPSPEQGPSQNPDALTGWNVQEQITVPVEDSSNFENDGHRDSGAPASGDHERLATGSTAAGAAAYESHPSHRSSPISTASPSPRHSLEVTVSSQSQVLTEDSTKEADPSKKSKKKRDRKFCMVARDEYGDVDSAWTRVFVGQVDEVAAHQGLFFINPTYERLVGEATAKIEEWVGDDLTQSIVVAASQSEQESGIRKGVGLQ